MLFFYIFTLAGSVPMRLKFDAELVPLYTNTCKVNVCYEVLEIYTVHDITWRCDGGILHSGVKT